LRIGGSAPSNYTSTTAPITYDTTPDFTVFVDLSLDAGVVAFVAVAKVLKIPFDKAFEIIDV